MLVNDYYFNYTVDPTAPEPVMLLNKHIGYDKEMGQGIEPEAFQAELLQLDAMGKKSINIKINSVGGAVLGGMAIYNAILTTKTPVNTSICGVAASIAAVIFMAGKTRTMPDYSLLMFHNPYSENEDADNGQINAFKNSIITMIATRVNKPEAEVGALMNKADFLNAAEALAAGFCTNVEGSGEMNKKRTLFVNADIAAMWQNGNTILNKLYKFETMKDILTVLNLAEGTPTPQITAAISGIKNQLDAATETVEAQKTEIERLKAENAAATETVEAAQAKDAEIEALKAENEILKTEAAAAATAKMETEAEAVVEAAVNAGKINPESKPQWLANAVKNLAEVKNQLETIPVTQKAPIIPMGGGANGVQKVANKMQALREKHNIS